MQDMAKVQPDLRLSYPVVLSIIKKIYEDKNIKLKHSNHKANCQAVLLSTVCKHRDAKAQKDCNANCDPCATYFFIVKVVGNGLAFLGGKLSFTIHAANRPCSGIALLRVRPGPSIT